MRRTPSAVAALLAAVLAPLLTACGGHDAPAAKPVSDARMATIVDQAVRRVDTAHADVDAVARLGGVFAVPVTISADISTQPAADTMTIEAEGHTIRGIVADRVLYLRSPMLGVGSKWARLDSGSLGPALLDPLGLLGTASHSISDASYLGKDGTGDHYRMTVALAPLQDVLGPARSWLTLPATATDELWVDAEGRVAKTVLTAGDALSVTAVLGRYGEPVHVAAPPADQVSTKAPRIRLAG